MFGIFSRKKSRTNDNSTKVISDLAILGNGVEVGYFSCIGYGDIENGKIIIGNNVKIGAYCIVHFGATIGDNVVIDDYSKIGAGVVIESGTRVLYGKHVYDEAKIGKNCIIGGHVADRTIIGNNVTYMGEIAHSHWNPNGDWDETVEPSPVIKDGTVIGVNALIIGGVEIGPCAYVGAGEIIRTNIGANMAYIKGTVRELAYYRGLFKARCNDSQL